MKKCIAYLSSEEKYVNLTINHDQIDKLETIIDEVNIYAMIPINVCTLKLSSGVYETIIDTYVTNRVAKCVLAEIAAKMNATINNS